MCCQHSRKVAPACPLGLMPSVASALPASKIHVRMLRAALRCHATHVH
jgi:hypothetical protein